MCCREETGWPTKKSDVAAGEWGSANICDLPSKTYQSMLDYIVNEVQPDLILWTGDNSAHDIYQNTQTEVIEYNQVMTQMLIDAIEGHNITVLPI